MNKSKFTWQCINEVRKEKKEKKEKSELYDNCSCSAVVLKIRKPIFLFHVVKVLKIRNVLKVTKASFGKGIFPLSRG